MLWPQWQGAGTSAVRALAPEFPFDVARRGYAVGLAVLEAVLPPHDGPTAAVPVTMSDYGLAERDGIEAKTVILAQLAAALEVIGHHAPARIATLGGECSVSVAPFSHLARRYGEDLAIVWIDSHLDIGTPHSRYPGYHAMAVATLTGHGDADVQELLPTTVSPGRVALAGPHAWAEDDFLNVASWGIQLFSPGEATRIHPAATAVARGHRLLARRHPLRRRRDRQQRDRARPGRRAGRSHQRPSAAYRRRSPRRRGRRRAHDRGVHPPAGDPPAADPRGLPADLRNDGGLTPARRPAKNGVTCS